jgi:predicted flap endonuclease-1-like 5' DNA nuclease
LIDAGVPRLRELIAKGGERYASLNPEAWTKQANFAVNNNWNAMKEWQRDNFQLVDGIDSKVEQLLNQAGIFTYEQLVATPVEKLQAILTAGGSQYAQRDPKTWGRQSQMLMDGKWDELKAWQLILRNSAGADGIKRDDLTRIFGLRSWVVPYLNQNGIYTYRHLMEAGVPRLRELMAKGGVRYSTLNPDSWVKQANFAMRGDWDAIKQWQRDDLKLIEGIGPKIEQLFNEAGVVTFEQLAAMPVEKMQAILTAAGPRYSIHDPKTWGRQSQMAADGKWEELKSWQQVLDGGKE